MQSTDFSSFAKGVAHGCRAVFTDVKKVEKKHQEVTASSQRLFSTIILVYKNFQLEKSLVKCIQIWLYNISIL